MSKTMSNIKEVKARGANVLLFIKDMGNISDDVYDECFLLPSLPKIFCRESLVLFLYKCWRTLVQSKEVVRLISRAI